MAVEVDGRLIDGLAPEKRFYRNFEGQPSTGVAIRSTALEDLYIVLVGWEADGSASFLVFVNPLVVWLWIGGIVAVFGAVVAMWPDPRPRTVPARQPIGGMAVSRA